MNVKILHFYPDLMSLYGSYANVSIVKRTLEQMGNSVTVERILPGAQADLTSADFLFMGAGTERAQKAALADFLRIAPALSEAAQRGMVMLFAGNSMELLGQSVTDSDGKLYEALSLAPFTSVQGTERYVEDVYAHTALYDAPVVGFMNKCSNLFGVDFPLLTSMDMGYGNDAPQSPEGYCKRHIFATELTGPVLIKNPELLRVVIRALYAQHNEAAPEIPIDRYMQDGYAITAEQLRLRCEK